MMVWSLRAPMFSLCSLAANASRRCQRLVGEPEFDVIRFQQRLILLNHRVLGLVVCAYLGKAGKLDAWMGKRPCSSGMRSDILATWNAPAAMNRI